VWNVIRGRAFITYAPGKSPNPVRFSYLRNVKNEYREGGSAKMCTPVHNKWMNCALIIINEEKAH